MSVGPYDHLGISDDAVRDEYKAQALVNAAKKLLIEAADHSGLMADRIRDGLDTLPNLSDWDDEIYDARRAT